VSRRRSERGDRYIKRLNQSSGLPPLRKVLYFEDVSRPRSGLFRLDQVSLPPRPSVRKFPGVRDVFKYHRKRTPDVVTFGYRLPNLGQYLPGYNQVMMVKRNVCRYRAIRKAVLFALGKAGPGQRQSPGQGGHYRRNESSDITCRR